jgi:hypothetical protein
MAKDEGFKLTVPGFDTDIKQGEVRGVTVSLQRGAYFKQGVTLQVQTPEGISVADLVARGILALVAF